LSDLSPVAAHFDRLVREHGATARGADYRDESSQLRRFRRFDDLALGVGSICDLGCGYAAYLDHLRTRGYTGSYVGVDVSPAMVEAARAVHPDADVRVGSDPVAADLVVAFGTFNVRGGPDDVWSAYVERSLRAMWDAATVAIAFDVLTRSVSEHLYSVGEDMVLRWLEPFGGAVTTSHDVGLGELAITVVR
jgi:SAM-dependent methyltransferase